MLLKKRVGGAGSSGLASAEAAGENMGIKGWPNEIVNEQTMNYFIKKCFSGELSPFSKEKLKRKRLEQLKRQKERERQEEQERNRKGRYRSNNQKNDGEDKGQETRNEFI